MKIDILLLERSTAGRDHEVSALLYYYLKKKYKVKIKSIFLSELFILLFRPKLIIMVNPYGSLFHFNILKSIKRYNIPIVTVIAEGTIASYEINNSFWGWNYDKKIIEDIYLIWSNKSKKIILENFPFLNKKIMVCGAIGFDRYKIYSYLKKDDFLKKYKKNYKKIIGIAGWGFEGKYPQSSKYKKMIKVYGEKQCKNFRDDNNKLNEIYNKLIANNKDILFILKIHPGQSDLKTCEFFSNRDLSKYKNTVVIKNELAISDCINVCDLWIGYETTTCLEAWLLDKQTFFVNPSGTDFPRKNYYKGNPVFINYSTSQKAIDEFYHTNILPGFSDKINIRKKIIEEVIQWDDGKNHIRASYIIEEFFKKNTNNAFSIKKINFKNIIKSLMFFLSKYRLFGKMPKINNLRRYSDIFNEKDLYEYNQKYEYQWNQFFMNNELSEAEGKKLRFINE